MTVTSREKNAVAAILYAARDLGVDITAAQAFSLLMVGHRFLHGAADFVGKTEARDRERQWMGEEGMSL